MLIKTYAMRVTSSLALQCRHPVDICGMTELVNE